jgi:hypothetical protein
MTETVSEDDDGGPWASPEIREGYEAALGRFMLAFNEADNRLTDIITTILTRQKRQDLIGPSTRQNFALKLLVLDLLKASREGQGAASVPIDQLRAVAGHRNILAHGHFDQNPFDGSYQVVSKNIAKDYPVEMLKSLTAEVAKACEALRHAEAFYDFVDAP